MLAAATMVATAPVSADADVDPCDDDHPDPYCVIIVDPPYVPTPPDPGEPDPGDPEAPYVDPAAPYWEPVEDTYFDEDGGEDGNGAQAPCWRIRAYEGENTGMNADEAAELGQQLYEEEHDPPLPLCPDDGDGDAMEWWMATPLPEMILDVPPGYAMTGVPAYLTIELDPVGDFDELEEHPDGGYVLVEGEAPMAGTIQIIAEPEFTIDWDEGEPTETDSLGVPYEERDNPDADEPIAHVYGDADEYEIVVEAEWEGYFTVNGGDREELGSARADEAEFELDVEQVQSIRRR